MKCRNSSEHDCRRGVDNPCVVCELERLTLENAELRKQIAELRYEHIRLRTRIAETRCAAAFSRLEDQLKKLPEA